MHARYEQGIYNIGVLLVSGRHKRAARIAEYMKEQGVVTHELEVMHSYAVAMGRGNGEALKMLSGLEGPLVTVARAQYQQRMGLNQEAVGSLTELVGQKGNSYVDQNINSLEIRLNGAAEQEQQYQDTQWVHYSHNKKEQQCLRAINQVTISYQRLKEQYKLQQIDDKDYQLGCRQIHESYCEVRLHYRPKGKLSNILSGFIDFFSSNIGPSQAQEQG